MWHGVSCDKEQVGRVSALTQRQVSFDAITLGVLSKQYVTGSLFPSRCGGQQQEVVVIVE